MPKPLGSVFSRPGATQSSLAIAPAYQSQVTALHQAPPGTTDPKPGLLHCGTQAGALEGGVPRPAPGLGLIL